MIRYCLKFVILMLITGISACASVHKFELVETPNIYKQEAGGYLENVPKQLATTIPEVFYVTDRQREENTKKESFYNSMRSDSMAFGEVRVQFGDSSWENLVQAAPSVSDSEPVVLDIKDVNEITRFPSTPLPFSIDNGIISYKPGVVADYEAATFSMQSTLSQYMRGNHIEDVFLFVHGVNNSFEEVVLYLANIWHATGRLATPILYSWPAGTSGVFGYLKDRESGEFSVYHLKETIRILARTEAVKRIHIMAHSRGTDITTTALRELVIETRAAQKDPIEILKIENLILAAPDLDFGIVKQRLIAEQFGPAFGQVTIYTNEEDGVLGLAQRFSSGLRFGRLTKDGLGGAVSEIFKQIKNVNFVHVDDVPTSYAHSYYRQHPGVLSDIVSLIRDRHKPGEPSRPLVHEDINFWSMPKNYPNH